MTYCRASSALLEVLDPEQNFAFNDHYLDLDYDLSHVMFVTTANNLHNIPEPLQDRMEIIELHSYTEEEKVKIVQGYLIPRQIKENGLTPDEVPGLQGPGNCREGNKDEQRDHGIRRNRIKALYKMALDLHSAYMNVKLVLKVQN